jgi:hypothetical protein
MSLSLLMRGDAAFRFYMPCPRGAEPLSLGIQETEKEQRQEKLSTARKLWCPEWLVVRIAMT